MGWKEGEVRMDRIFFSPKGPTGPKQMKEGRKEGAKEENGMVMGKMMLKTSRGQPTGPNLL
jgi:hypothetical protein